MLKKYPPAVTVIILQVKIWMDINLEKQGLTTVAGSVCSSEPETENKMSVTWEQQFILY